MVIFKQFNFNRKILLSQLFLLKNSDDRIFLSHQHYLLYNRLKKKFCNSLFFLSKNEYRCRWKKHSKNAIIIVINKYKVEIQNSKTFIEKILGNKGGEITQMTIDEIKKLIQNGEKIDVEFKVSKNTLTKDVFDTVCSFNNRNGGHILLGINDKREIVGVSEDRVDKVIKEFTTSINNPQKIYPPLY